MKILRLTQPEYNPLLIRGIRWGLLLSILGGAFILILDLIR
jgi:hypothetical protein